MQKFVIIDGLCLLFRSFHAIKDMANKNGQNIAGIYGFARELVSIKKQLEPDYMAVAVDTGKKTWRHDLTDSYKANRKKTPPELAHQFGWLRDLCNVCGVYVYEASGYEADDCIASCAVQYSDKAEICIVTYDKDLCQLVQEGVYVRHPFKGGRIGIEEVIQKYHVHPSKLRDFLALTGDAVDGIVGIRGIGPKTAANWLNEYGNLDNIIANIPELRPQAKSVILSASLDKLQLAKELVSLNTALDIGHIERAKLQEPCAYKLSAFLKEAGLESLGFDFLDTFCARRLTLEF